MDIAELEALVELVKDARISELTLKQGDKRVTIRKPMAAAVGTALVPVGDVYEAEVYDAEDVTVEAVLNEPETVTITAPVVGYFHHVKPIVGLGASVAVGQTIGLVKAMQLNNEVAATVRGTITDLLVEDGQPVEYGQPLYVVQPD